MNTADAGRTRTRELLGWLVAGDKPGRWGDGCMAHSIAIVAMELPDLQPCHLYVLECSFSVR